MRSHFGFSVANEFFTDRDGAVFVEGTVIAEAVEIKFQRTWIPPKPARRRIIEMNQRGEIRLAR